MRQTFTKRILFFLFLVIPAPLLLNLVVLSFFSFAAVKTTVIQDLHTKTMNVNLELEKKIAIQTIFLKRLAETLALKRLTTTNDFFTEAYSEMVALGDSDLSLCLLSSANDSIRTKNPRDPFVRYIKTHPEIRNQLVQNPKKVSLVSISEDVGSEEHYLVFAEPLPIYEDPSLTGWVIAFYSMQKLRNYLFQNNSSHHNLLYCYLNKNGQLLFSDSDSLQQGAFSLSLAGYPSLSSPLPSHALEASPKFFKAKELLQVSLEGKTFLAYLSSWQPIPNTYSLALIPLSTCITQALRLPINVIFFYTLAFSLMGWVLSSTSKRLNRPLQELTVSMESVWKGNHNVRYEPQPYGYEINELGNIFNCTLLLLLNVKEKADVEYISGNVLQKELALLSSLQDTLLCQRSNELPGGTFSLHYLKGAQQAGLFYGWIPSLNKDSLFGVIGIAGDIGLPSYLYALSARSLFLTYASLGYSLASICDKTIRTFDETTVGNEASVSMVFIEYQISSKSLSVRTEGTNPPVLFLKRREQLLSIAETQVIESGDILVCLTGGPHITHYLQTLPVEALLKDPLAPLNSENFAETLTAMLKNKNQTQIDGAVGFFSFI
ncbi:MAG: SpoIIE family protein phosphatase [Chlamydia sp.]|nr:SpoIIE family protein phosphatase [Chlamydia sp.]